MQAIRTRYHGPTSTRGSAISAKCEAGAVRVPYDHALNLEDNHKAACAALLKKFGWDTPYYGATVCGVFGGDYFHVFDDKRLQAIFNYVQFARRATPTGNPWCSKEFRALVDCLARDANFFGPATDFELPAP